MKLHAFLFLLLFPFFSIQFDVCAAKSPPNVVLIISDDQAWGDYGFMGHPFIQTPNLDRLAYDSLVYPRAYLPTSLCRPSLASIITGLYPYQHKITGNDPAPQDGKKAGEKYKYLCEEMTQFIEQAPTLPGMLAQKEYVSFQTGKWWQGSYKRGGFTHGMTHGDPNRGGRHGDEGLKIGREGMQPIFDFIEEAGDKPFFLWYAPFVPHLPHNPPERLLKKYRDKTESLFEAKYWAMCEWFDETCGQMLDYLDQNDLTDNTLVVYICDNGWIQSRDSRRYAAKSKQSPYDGGIRTPIMIRYPGKMKAQTVFTPVSSIDLVPTILTACGINATETMKGVNLLDQKSVRSRDAVFGDIYLHDAQDLQVPKKSLKFRWCIQDRWKLILPEKENVQISRSENWGNHKNDEIVVELFDVLADPHETKNLAKQQPEIVEKMTKLIDEWYPVK